MNDNWNELGSFTFCFKGQSIESIIKMLLELINGKKV